MASLDTGGGDGGSKKGKHQKKRAKKASTHIDMTPMVDLAFLLLTFFMLTTTFSKPKTLEINMPAKDDAPPKEITNALTLLIKGDEKKGDKLFWYYNALKQDTKFESTSLSKDGLRKLLLEKNVYALEELKKIEKDLTSQDLHKDTLEARYKRARAEVFKKSKALTVLLKSDDNSKYKTVVDILDELKIADVGRFAIVDMDSLEVEILKTF